MSSMQLWTTRRIKKPGRLPERGQALVEFALILVFLLMLIFVIIETGRVLFAWNAVQNAAREGARYGITGQFDPAFQNQPNPRAASIWATTHDELVGLPLNENPNRLFEDDYYYNIEVWGVPLTDTTQLHYNNAGGPGLPLIVRVTYRVPIIAPILNGIVSSIPVFGQTVLNNEQFGSLGNATSGMGLPPPLPVIPTPGPTPSSTPTPTGTPTNTPGPTATMTPTASNTPTATPVICATRFEGELVAGNDFAFVTGEPGETVVIIDLVTGVTLGADVLVAVNGHACAGFADFLPGNTFSSPLVAGHVILVQSNNGTQDTAIVSAAPSTPTPTPSRTPTVAPTPTNTATPTKTPTPNSPYIVLSSNCGMGPAVSFTVYGYGWPNTQDVNLFFDNNLQTIIPAGHGGTLPPQTWSFPIVSNAVHTVRAITAGGSTHQVPYTVPCPNITPTPPTATPTSTPNPADLVWVSVPELISTPPIVEYKPLDFRIHISNTGDIDINDQFFVDLYFDPPIVLTNSIPITLSAGYMGISQLSGGAGRTLVLRTYGGLSGGFSDHEVYGMVDSLQEIDEGDEGNNIVGPGLITGVIPGPTPTPSPTPGGGANSISGIVKARLSDWFAQHRALVKLVNQGTGRIDATALTNQDGVYTFNDVAPGTYTIVACQQLDGIWFQGLRINISVPPSTMLADVWMRDQDIGVCP